MPNKYKNQVYYFSTIVILYQNETVWNVGISDKQIEKIIKFKEFKTYTMCILTLNAYLLNSPHKIRC